MGTESLNCRCCGGVLNVKSNLCVCDYCGTTNFISDVASKYIIQLNRANKLRQESEFDNAARIYDTILKENSPTADILWLRTLCEYGIEYVPDPVSDKYFPTLHRINDESILNCSFFKQAMDISEGMQKETIQKEAEYIDKVQIKYLNIASNEDPYDVFICYKETDVDTGEKTEDVRLSEELFNELTGRGYKVFFARETLKEKLSVEYEPYIFAALKSARVMAVIGTKAEYFTSVWVKNEWGRFLKLMEKNPDKQMFFACDDPEELPRAFASKQAQILGKENAIKNLADNIDNYLKEEYRGPAASGSGNSFHQDEFDRILEAKSIEYVKDFRNTEFGRKKNEIMNRISKSASVFDRNNDKFRWSFAVGVFLFILGNILMFLMMVINSELSDGGVGKSQMVQITIISAPLIIAGIIIAFSYNWIVDLITSSFVIAVLLGSSVTGNEFMPFLAIFVPIAVYPLTAQYRIFNNYLKRMDKAGREIEKELEELQTIIGEVSDDMREVAMKLLKQYKEDNENSSLIGLKDDDYYKGLRNFNHMYEAAEEKYAKYVGYPNYRIINPYQKVGSKLSLIALILVINPLTTLFAFVVVIIDILRDKYYERSHALSYIALLVDIILVLCMVGFVCMMRW